MSVKIKTAKNHSRVHLSRKKRLRLDSSDSEADDSTSVNKYYQLAADGSVDHSRSRSTKKHVSNGILAHKVVYAEFSNEDDDASGCAKAKAASKSSTQNSISQVTLEALAPLVEKIVVELVNNKKLSLPPTLEPRGLLKSVRRRSFSSSDHNDDVGETSRGRERPKPGEVEIMPGSGVYVEHAELRFMDRWRTRPSQMVRKLMLYLVGATKLKNMTARGKGGKNSKARDQIPPRILEAVKDYVDRKCIYKLPEAEYIRCINQQCGTLRNPHMPLSQNEKEHQTFEAPDLSNSD